jgi:hypothetical protein
MRCQSPNREQEQEKEVLMYRAELQRLEGVWTGKENIIEGDRPYEATARLVFQTVFDGRFLLCDYTQSIPNRPTSVAHGVFRKDASTDALTVTWFRCPAAVSTQQTNAVAEGDALVFVETVDGQTTRTRYTHVRDQLSIRTELAIGNDNWTPLLEGSYRRR